jgi:ATP-dependent helicase/nuclease subunit B
MSVRFILGRSGSGKTRYCIDSIASRLRDGSSSQNLVLLVPEQATYQAERAILLNNDIPGFHNLKILSFDRLGFWLDGKSSAGAELSKIARQMVIDRLLRANKDKLKIFEKAADLPGTAAKLAGIITELHECDVSLEDMHQLNDRLSKDQPNSITTLKYSDISIIFQKYLEFIQDNENNFINPDARLSNACSKVADADFLKNAVIWVDGFASFTAQQQQLLAQILKVSLEAEIALCLDPSKINISKPTVDSLNPASLFSTTEFTYCELFQMSKKCGLNISAPICLDKAHRFDNSPDLRILESSLFDVRKSKAVKSTGSISITTSADPRGEVQCVADQIHKLVRDDDFKFKDIAVIVSDMSVYQHYIEAAFSDYGISHFIDRTRSLAAHPVVELLSSALRAALEGFSSLEIFAYLKTGLTSIAPSDIDLLENYCLAYGIDGCDWISNAKWDFADKNDSSFDPEHIEQLRQKAIAPLVKLKDALSGQNNDKLITASEFVCALWEILDSLDVKKRLSELAGPNPDDEHEHFQFYEKMINLLDEIVEVFALDAIPAEDFSFMLSNAFSRLVLKSIPPKLDQVLVGSIERSRHPDLKAVFLLGTTQKQFPSAISFDSILTDQDRTLADEYDFELKGKLSQQLAERQYLAYIAFTRPSEKLFISYPRTVDGKEVVKSSFLNDLISLFTDLTEIAADTRTNIGDVCTQSQLEDIVCASGGKDTTLTDSEKQAFLGLIDSLRNTDAFSESGQKIKYAVEYENTAKLDAKQLASTDRLLTCSAGRLSSFAACPFQHFAKYTLGLKKRKLFTFASVDIGSFYHAALDGLSKKLKALGKDLATVEQEELLKLLHDQIKELVKTDIFYSNFISKALHNKYIIFAAEDVLAESVLAYSKMSKAGHFRQKISEHRFGWQNKHQYQLDLSGKGKLNLRGIIDRVDTADINGKSRALVFDYKTKPKSFSWQELFHGLNMQLAIYLLVLSNAKIGGQKIGDLAGAFYLPIDAGIKDDGEKFGHKAKGFFNAQFVEHLDTTAGTGSNQYYNFYVSKDGPYGRYLNSGILKQEKFKALLDFTKKRITSFAEQILDGVVDITPYRLGKKSPCGYCDYRAVCRFDRQINTYNTLPTLNKQQILDQMEVSDAG